jgi:dipeptidyl aminopeptidase/acylaminoacyl peptidase
LRHRSASKSTSGDLARELKWIADPAFQAESQKPRATGTQSRSARIAWMVAAAAVIAALFVSWIHFREAVPEQRSTRFTIPTEARLPSQVRISPDGTRLAFVGQNPQGKAVLWIRPLDKQNSQPLTGTEGAKFPFWSPDSRHIAFYDQQQGKLKRIDSSGGQPQILGDAIFGLGGDWGDDGTILFATGEANSGISRVAANGGVPVEITTPAPSSSYSFPHFLPDGRHFLYLAKPEEFSSARDETSVLCPDNDISGGRVLWKGTRKVRNRAGQMFRQAAYSLHHSLTPMGDYLRRMKTRLGPAAATTATAHKIAVIFYTMVKNQVEYDETIWATRDVKRQQRIEARLKRQANQLGYQLVPLEEKPAA